MTIAESVWLIVFCTSFSLALYAFIGYPILMWIVVRVKRAPVLGQPVATPHAQQSVSVVVAAYNEQATIAATLKTLLAQDYADSNRGRYEIVVFSDGSTDATDQIVKQFAGHGVRLIRFEGRLGKTECQNRVVEQLTSDLVVFSDGNILWQPSAVRRLVEPLQDQRVAATTGALQLIRGSTLQTENNNEGLFRRLDHIIKAGESRVLSTVGVNGPLYAVRRSEYIRLQPHLVSDLVLPVLLVARGKRVSYVPEAIGLEPATPSVWSEFGRKRRLVTQGLVALPLLIRAAHPLRRPALFGLLLSHKILRWVGVELLAIAFISAIVLAAYGQSIFAVIVVTQLLALLAAGLGLLFSGSAGTEKPQQPLLGALSFFVLTNLASLVAVIDVVRGETATRWRTQR